MRQPKFLYATAPIIPAAALFLSACGVGSAPYASGPATKPGTTVNSVSGVGSQPSTEPKTTGTKAYVGLFKDNAVGVIDTATNKLLTTIPVPAGPHGLVVTPDGRKVYVSSDGDSKVSVIDAATDKVVNSIDVGQTPHGLTISKDGKEVVVSGFGTDQAEIIDTGSDQVVEKFAVPAAHNSAISPDGRLLYVGSQKKDATALFAFDLLSKSQLATIPVKDQPRSENFSPDGKLLHFTLVGTDAVEVLDTASNRLVAEVPTGAAPHHVLFTPDGKLALTVAQGPGDLNLIDPAKNALIKTVKVGSAPHWIGLSSDGKTAYVTNETSNDVSIVDLPMQMLMSTIPQIGNAPRKIALQPGQVGPDSQPAPRASASNLPSGARSPGPGRSAAAGPVQPVTFGSVSYVDNGTKDASGQVTVSVDANDYSFSPTFVRAAPGQKLTLDITNKSGTLHNFSIASQQIDRDLKPHETVTVDVTIPQSGALRFFCKYHAALGMNGELLAGSAAPQAAVN